NIFRGPLQGGPGLLSGQLMEARLGIAHPARCFLDRAGFLPALSDYPFKPLFLVYIPLIFKLGACSLRRFLRTIGTIIAVVKPYFTVLHLQNFVAKSIQKTPVMGDNNK